MLLNANTFSPTVVQSANPLRIARTRRNSHGTVDGVSICRKFLQMELYKMIVWALLEAPTFEDLAYKFDSIYETYADNMVLQLCRFLWQAQVHTKPPTSIHSSGGNRPYNSGHL